MTDLQGSKSTPPHVTLRERCRVMGIPTWRYSAGGHALDAPADDGAAGFLARTPTIERLVDGAVARWIREDAPTIREIAPGMWLVPFVEQHRRRRRAFTVALMLGPESVRSDTVQTALSDVGASAGCKARVAAVAVHSERTVEIAAQSIGWLHEDLTQLAESGRAVETFSSQLAESYEEINLLYSLGRSMNDIEHPQRFVDLACQELLKTLSYNWIGAYFTRGQGASRVLAGLSVIAGRIPCPRAVFEVTVAEMIPNLEQDAVAIVQGDEGGPLTMGGEHALAHLVTSGGSTVGVIIAGGKRGEDVEANAADMKLLEAAAGYTSVVIENAHLYEVQRDMFLGTLEALTAAIDAKDPYTRGHSQRVAHLSRQIALALGHGEQDAERVRICGLVHDIGKIGIPESILRATGRLTDEEFEVMKEHPAIGHHILHDIPTLDDVLPAVLYHHERFDGKGYPSGLGGEDIPMVARIVCLADAFDAMSSTRTYRKQMTRAVVLEEVARCAGAQFDPDVVSAFQTIDLARYDQMLHRHQAEIDSHTKGREAA
ncbi:MAG: HD-GYP domain-containing protein [Phycisphaerales bacterium]|nr:HD-GYP domain-containing protein [Phycisphaerales bacterium]